MPGFPSSHEVRRVREHLDPPDAPIDSSIPYRSRETGASRHFGFFPFFAKKPWQVIQAYIKYYTRTGDLVCDPFAGSGVTPVEALILNRRAVASDINPVARFITRMTAVSPVDLEQLEAANAEVRAATQADIEALDAMSDAEVEQLLGDLDYPRLPIPSTVRRTGAATVDDLHTIRQLAALTLLRDGIARVGDPTSRDLLRVALANTARYCNVMYILPFDKGRRRSPYRGDVGFLRRFSYSRASSRLFYENRVWPTFEHTYKSVVDAKAETNRLIGERYNPHTFKLAGVPASMIHQVTGEQTVDYCFTDPPYSNDIHFLDLSTLWAAWLGLEITQEDRRAELLIGGTQSKSREQFEIEFAAAMESIGRALKDDHWFTLVYKHRDLSLWQRIVSSCEEAGLRYVNSIWQKITIPSTRQNESPDINPSGDMYLNFRKMATQRFEAIYGRAPVVDLPTRPRYVELAVERIIVSYLGADIGLITSHVIQLLLDSRAFHAYTENPENVAQDLAKVLDSPRFASWQLSSGSKVWIMAPGQSLDQALPAIDRARYLVFDLLRSKDEATEAQVAEHLLTRFAQEPGKDLVTSDVASLLRSAGREAAPHRWQFDVTRITDFKQLWLLFPPSTVEEIHDLIDQRHDRLDAGRLRIDLEGIALIRDRLRAVNSANAQFASQYDQMMTALQTVLGRLQAAFAHRIDQVLAVGTWAEEGIDLRDLPYEEIVLQIVVRGEERPFALYWQIAEDVFGDLEDGDLLLQFQLATLAEWQHAETVTRGTEQGLPLGVRLLGRR